MSLLHMDGFDRYASRFDFLANGYTNIDSDNFEYGATDGRFGGVALIMNDWNQGIARGFQASTTVIIGLAMKIVNEDAGGEFRLFQLMDGESTIARVDVSSDGSVTAEVGGSEVASASGVVGVGVWHFFEMKYVVADSGGRFIVEVDQNREIDFTGDTEPGSGTEIDGVRIWNPGWNDAVIHFDDIRIMDDAGTKLNDLIGDARIYTLAPDSDVAANWTPSGGGDNHDDVDEVPNDGDTTYVEASGPTSPFGEGFLIR